MKKLLLMIVAMFMAIAVSAQTNKKVIYLKNGTVVRGVVIDQVPGQSIKVRTADGSIFMYTMAEIKMIERDEIIDYETIKKQRSSQLHKGWNCYIEAGIGMFKTDEDFDDEGKGFGFNITSSYGYRFNKHIFLGVGTGLYYTITNSDNAYMEDIEGDKFIIPVFTDFRYTMLDKKTTPFISLKTGFVVCGYNSLFLCPSFGLRVKLNPQLGLNIGVEYTNYLVGYKNIYDNYRKTDKDMHTLNFKIGIDF